MTAESGAPEPRRILVAGDWHGNEDWALSVIRRVPSMLADEPRRLILQLGDFGSGRTGPGQHYLAQVSALLAEVDAELWFIDGNHEDFPQLARLAGRPHPGWPGGGRPRLFHLPRGYRWTWHGLRWLGCGGAVSLDRAQAHRGRGLVARRGDHRRAGGDDHRRRPRGRAGQSRLPGRRRAHVRPPP